MLPMIGVLLVAFLASAPLDSSNIVEVDIGHGYAGSESFAMSGDRVIHTQHIADVSGEVDVHRAILHPNAKVRTFTSNPVVMLGTDAKRGAAQSTTPRIHSAHRARATSPAFAKPAHVALHASLCELELRAAVGTRADERFAAAAIR